MAALFALHPLHVESVAWVAERKDVLSTFFWLLTMWAYVWYVERPGFRRYLLVLLSFGLGLMAKPMLVTLPLVLLLLDYWPLARWSPRAAEAAGEPETSGPGVSLKHLVREKVPLLALAVLCSLITLYGQQVSNTVVPLARFPLTMRLADACMAYLSYLTKMIWPSRLAIMYPLSLNRPPLWQPLGAALVLAVLSFLAIRLGRRHPYLPVGWFWYLVTLAPVIGVVQVGLQASAGPVYLRAAHRFVSHSGLGFGGGGRGVAAREVPAARGGGLNTGGAGPLHLGAGSPLAGFGLLV